mmetsp:Transcript_28597/g.58439  ORF Transcript_28597/g.58439 Transcript_28597/m.58439 type:complete len:331 (+) Transcript_28597:143-1135(+)|eukprot:CAMPEP_0181310388 /NCGR_PEP_ID=MMETSP1101-20121128/12559_1 /TAXON_ID=46948 /ORGANISM="Rhodomonas abbreviata, Strain Caron Lab Isolate" /LENGTH=330 /DNA_ID=CAMNT_0023417013 /DNA_START=137 /DNA_END=1129 /DNA_ORIENTATION=+
MCKPRDIRTIVAGCAPVQAHTKYQAAQEPPSKDVVDFKEWGCNFGGDDSLPLAWDVESWRKSVDSGFWKLEDTNPNSLIEEEFGGDIESCMNQEATSDDVQPDSPTSQSDSDNKSSVRLHADFKRVGGAIGGKWRRRDITKHLAGERNRRAKRMGKVQQLRSMLPELAHSKPTVNQILMKTIELIQEAKVEKERVSSVSTPSEDTFFRDTLRSSSHLATLAVDANMCVIDASIGMRTMLRWSAQEDGLRGQHLSAIMHPEDASMLSQMVDTHRSMHKGFGMQASAVFNTFSSVDSSCNLVFPSGYLPRCPLTISVYGNTTVILVESFIPV